MRSPTGNTAGRQRWPWWKVVGAILLWPFTLLWWVWRRSAWETSGKVVVTVAITLLFLGSAVYSAVAPRAPRIPAPTNPTSGAPTAEPTAAAPPFDADPRSQVLKWSYFGDKWPLTVPEATVSCRGASAVVLTVNGKDYAVNGTAMTQFKSMPTIRDDGLWRDAESGPGPKINIDPIMDVGLGLCEGKTFTPTTVTTGTVMPTSTLDVPQAASPNAGCNAAFAAWERVGGAVEPSDPLVVAALTNCSDVAEWRGGLERHPKALDYESAAEISDGAIRSDLVIICADEQRSTPVCADAIGRRIVH